MIVLISFQLVSKSNMFNPTPYKISTITATGSIGTHINLDILYNKIKLVDYHVPDALGFIYIEYGFNKTETCYKGFHKKLNITRRKIVEIKRFDNQATVILRTVSKDNVIHCINCKMFRNGNVQMTGVKYIEQGEQVQDAIIEMLRTIHDKSPNVVEDIAALAKSNYRIRLINSDFRIGFDIKRDKLCNIVQATENIYCSYEPCTYPGVKMQYNFNSFHRARLLKEQERLTEEGNKDGSIRLEEKISKMGACQCENYCNGKGSGCAEGACKKITIAAFQSGCIIITGAQTHEQIHEAYNFICDVIQRNKEKIIKEQLPLPDPLPPKQRKKRGVPVVINAMPVFY